MRSPGIGIIELGLLRGLDDWLADWLCVKREFNNICMRPDECVLTALKQYGLLLLTDSALPNLCRLVAGERVRGSWWAHPRAQAIFQAYGALEDHPDVLILKLISGKVTYIHRTLWSQIVAVGRAREPWQLQGLSAVARKLLAAVDQAPVEPAREKAAAARELDARMLVFSAQFHSESGAHVRRLESWDHWSNRTRWSPDGTTPASARKALEERIANLNHEFAGRGRLPWQGKLE